jgi:hypothetical protein
MDALLESLGRLLGIFKEPVQVLMLLVIVSQAFGIYKLVVFFLDRTDKDMEARVKLATSLDGLADIIDRLEKTTHGKHS